MLFQIIEVSEIPYPAATDQLLQHRCREPFDPHPGLFAKVREFLHQLGCTVRIGTVQLACAARGVPDCERLAAAGAGHWQYIGIALRLVIRNLRNDQVCLVHTDLISDAKLKCAEIS